MEHNRMLQISTAGNRKATHWPKSEILWSDFTDKLKTPVRGMETLDQYLALPKSRQDELKDVGGFVGGTFTGERQPAWKGVTWSPWIWIISRQDRRMTSLNVSAGSGALRPYTAPESMRDTPRDCG